MPANEPNRERARTAVGEELASLLHHHSPDVLLALLDNPALDETQLCLLLDRKALLKNYRVKRALAFHPRTPRLASMRLIRELYLMDLVQLTLLPGISAELKRNAEEQLIARLPQLPLGQKVTLSRRGTARVAGALLAEGHAQVLSIVLDNPQLTEAQVLKALSRDRLPLLKLAQVSPRRNPAAHPQIRKIRANDGTFPRFRPV